MKKVVGLISLAVIALLFVGFITMNNAKADTRANGKIISNVISGSIEVK